MRVKNNVYINLRTDFNSAVKRIYVNFSRIIDTQRDSSFMAKLSIKLHETSIRSCIEYPYPSGFFFLFSFFFFFFAESGFLVFFFFVYAESGFLVFTMYPG